MKINTILFAISLMITSFSNLSFAGAAEPQKLLSSLSGIDPHTLVFVTNRDSNDIAVIDTKTDKVIARIPLGKFTNAHMSMLTHDGKKLLVSATGRDQFLIVDLATLSIEDTVATGAAPEHFGITKDNRYAYVGNMDDDSVSLIDLRKGSELKRFAGFPEPHGFSLSGKGDKMYVSTFGAHEVRSIDIPTQRMAKRFAIGTVHRAAISDKERYQSELKGVANPTLSIDGKTLYAADGDSGQLGIIDTETDRVISTIKVGDAPWRAYASPDGQWMLVPNNGDESVSVISTRTQKVVSTLKGGPTMTGVNFVQGGKKAYVISQGESVVYVYDLENFKQINRLKIGNNLALETASTTADGKKVYLASSTDDAIYVIDGATDEVTRIANVGRFPWGVTILGAASQNYCH